MRVAIKRTDGRFKGSGHWKYYVDLDAKYKSDNKNFFAVREWCWTTFGPSKEIDAWLADREHSSDNISQNENWCWHFDMWTSRIYLKSDKEADWFSLKYA